MDELSADLAIEVAVMEMILEDHASGRVPSLAELLARFPGYADQVSRAFARAEAHGSTAIGDPGAARSPRDVRNVGPYCIQSELGRGAQGVVYLAVDERLGRRVALKVLLPSWAASPRALRRFENEARMLAALDHPGLCNVYEAATVDGTPFIAMRFVAGESLTARITHASLRRGDALPRTTEIEAAVVLIEKSARAVHAAHDAGVIHRDLKPGNVIVSEDGAPTILDFGLASSAEDELQSLTVSGDIIGTPAYMSPEQAAGRTSAVDRRTDIHALGVMLFELVTGRRPFDAPTRDLLLEAVRKTDAPAARRVNPAVPIDLGTVIARCLAKEAAHRYPSALELADDLRRVRLGEPVDARPVSSFERATRWVRRNPLRAALAVMIALLAVTIVAGGTWYLANRPRLAAQAEAELHARVEEQLSRGSEEMGNRRYRPAVARFEEALRIDPGCVEAVAALAICLTTVGRADEAAQRLDDFAAAHGRPPAWESTRQWIAARLHPSESRAASRPEHASALDDLTCYVEALRELTGGGASQTGMNERACAWFEDAIQRAPARRILYLENLAATVGKTRRLETARRVAGTVRNVIGGARGEMLAGLALCVPDPAAARAAFANAEALGADAIDIGYGMITVLLDARQLDDAAALANDLLRQRRDDATLYYDLSVIEEARRDMPAACRAAERAVELRPDVAANHLQLGIVLRDGLSRPRDAVAAFRNALARDPGSTATITALALTLTLTGEAAEALELAERALRNTPEAEQAWHAAGRAHLKLGHPVEAEAAMRRAVAIRPENVGLRLDHVRTLAAAGRLADARALFDDWLERGISEGMGSFVRFVAKELEDAEARAESR